MKFRPLHDRVVVKRIDAKIDNEDLLIMKESDVMGVLDVPASKKKAA